MATVPITMKYKPAGKVGPCRPHGGSGLALCSLESPAM